MKKKNELLIGSGLEIKNSKEKNIFLLGDMQKILNNNEFQNKKFDCIITGVPDMDEIRALSKSKTKYYEWVNEILELLFDKVSDDGYIIFLQTDRKKNGEWIQKSNLISSLAYEYGFKCMWHKIMLYREPEKIHLQRPTYGHILCFSINGTPGKSFPDVIFADERLYKNGTPIQPLEYICKFLKNKKIKHILDPFAGMGTIAMICNKYKISSTNIEINKKVFSKMLKNLEN
jgi:hypothetical protein